APSRARVLDGLATAGRTNGHPDDAEDPRAGLTERGVVVCCAGQHRLTDRLQDVVDVARTHAGRYVASPAVDIRNQLVRAGQRLLSGHLHVGHLRTSPSDTCSITVGASAVSVAPHP